MTTVANLLWLVLVGWWLWLVYIACGIINFIFIVTIPAGVQSFKLAGFALWPFGKAVVDTGRTPGFSLLLNLIWIVTGGFWISIAHLVAGAVLCVTIVGIPFGLANFRMAGLALAPFGRKVVPAREVTEQMDAMVMRR